MNSIINIGLYLSSERPEMMAMIYDKLRRAGYIHASVDDNSIGYHCFINFFRFKDKNRKRIPSLLRFLTPLEFSVFAEYPSQLEAGKTGWLKMIQSVNKTKKYAKAA